MTIDRDFSVREAEEICELLISGNLETEKTIEILKGFQDKGETVEEIAGFAKAIISKAQKIPFDEPTIDLCGTGGSKFDRFNVSTSVAFIVSCFDLKVAKHGNKGSKKPNGSFDLLEGLCIPIDLNGEQIADCLNKVNLSFIFARKAHPAMRNVAEARKQIQGRTIFNLAGPLSNPTKIISQVIGTAEKKMQQPLLEVAQLLGRKSISVVFGEPAIDELSIAGKSNLILSINGKTETIEWSPESIGLLPVPYHEMPTGLVENNISVFNRLLENEKLSGINDMVCINAALSLFCAGIVSNIEEGYKASQKVIQSGDMKRKYEDYKMYANKIFSSSSTF